MSAINPGKDRSDAEASSILETSDCVDGATMTETEKAAIAVCRDDIIRDVQVIHIIDFLMEHKVISEQEKKHIFDSGIQMILTTGDYKKRQEAMREQAKSLLNVLENKNAFKHFIASLEHNNSYPWIAEKLLALKDKFSNKQPFYKMLAKMMASQIQ